MLLGGYLMFAIEPLPMVENVIKTPPGFFLVFGGASIQIFLSERNGAAIVPDGYDPRRGLRRMTKAPMTRLLMSCHRND